MKTVLDPKIKKDQITSVQDSSSDDEEVKKSKELESILHQVLNNIEQSLRKVPDLVPKNCLYNFNDEDMKGNTTSLFSEVEISESSKRKTDFNDEIVTDFNEEIVTDLNEEILQMKIQRMI